MDEVPLDGGITNVGKVVRVGPHVLRPATAHTASIHAFLRHVRDAGFDGAPMPIGVDDDGRERLTFIEGDVPVVPYPEWSQTDVALASIARLMRGLHDAATGFDHASQAWNSTFADPAGGATMCHNDVELSNIVFRDGVAVALIDFEFAAPGSSVHDLAQMARLCVPIEHQVDKDRMGWDPPDGPARLRLVADAYGLDATGRADLLAATERAMVWIEAVTRRSVEIGGPSVAAAIDSMGGLEKFARRRDWWAEHHDRFVAALL